MPKHIPGARKQGGGRGQNSNKTLHLIYWDLQWNKVTVIKESYDQYSAAAKTNIRV